MIDLMYCGICCWVLSWWGTLQLLVMGFIFYYESPTFFEECEAEEYDDYDDFIKKTKLNYSTVAVNCWVAAIGYIITMILSYACIKKAKSQAQKRAKLEEDDEYVCNLAASKLTQST